MSRTKVRNYPTTEKIKYILNDYFQEHEEDVIKDLLDKTGFDSIENLQNAEHYSYFGFDCGWVWLATANYIQEEEWIKDNGKYDAKVRGIQYPFNCQSVTCKKIQLEKAIKDLGLTGQYYAEVRLD